MGFSILSSLNKSLDLLNVDPKAKKIFGVVNDLYKISQNNSVNPLYASSSTETINNSISQIEKNVSRKNRFSIQMTLPSIGELNSFDIRNLDLYVQNASLPSQNLQLAEVKYLNKRIYTSIFTNVDSINMTFYDTKDQSIRTMFINWQKAITPVNRLSLLKYFPDEYQTNFKIIIHNTTYEVVGSSPSMVGDFQLSHGATNELGTFDVTFICNEIK